MKKVIINARFLTQDTTGVQRFGMEISKELKKKLPDIRFISPKNIIHTDLADYLDVEVYGNFSGHLWEQIELPRYLKKQGNPLLINLANTAPLFYNNYIATIHDLSFLQFPNSYSRKFYYYYNFLIPKVAHHAKNIITVSNSAKKTIAKLLNQDLNKITIVHNAVSINFNRDQNELSHLGNYILTVASYNPIKNLHRLIEAFNLIDSSNTKLIIVGASNQSFPNQDLTNNNNPNIIFLGHISDQNQLASLYKNAKLFVLPSLYESFGIPNLEAMTCGCPVITSSTGALPEICGEAAYYIDPYDVNDIAKALSNVLNNLVLQENLRQKGLERVKLYNWQNSAEKLITVINRS